MTPQYLPVRHRHPARRCPVRTFATLIIVLVAGAAGATRESAAEQATSDTLSAPASHLPEPPAASEASAFTASRAAPLTTRLCLGGMLRADRLSHASFGLAIGVGVGLSTREPVAGVGSVVALAIAKELLDDRFDRSDLAAGAAGAALAWMIVAALTR